MTPLTNFSVVEIDVAKLDRFEGQILIFAADSNNFDVVSHKINGLTNGALERFLGSKEFEKLGNGKVHTLSFPTGLAAQSLLIAKINQNASIAEARSCGVEICKSAAGVKLLLAAGHFKRLADLVEGIGLRNYEYLDQKTNATPKPLNVTIMVKNVSMQSSSIAAKMAVVDGVFFTRDLVNAPANVLTTTTFAEQLIKLSELGIDVQVLDEP